MKDADGDGYGDKPGSDFVAGTDCDDDRSAVNPSVNENCGTAYDDDCNGKSNDEGADSCSDFFADVDGDGFGTGTAKCMCEPEDVYVAASGDCDDTRPYTFPGAAENEAVSACHKDQDEDGYGDSSPPGGVTAGTDCDDDRNAVNPDPARKKSAVPPTMTTAMATQTTLVPPATSWCTPTPMAMDMVAERVFFGAKPQSRTHTCSHGLRSVGRTHLPRCGGGGVGFILSQGRR